MAAPNSRSGPAPAGARVQDRITHVRQRHPPNCGRHVGKHFLDLGFFPTVKPLRRDDTETGITQLTSMEKTRLAQALDPAIADNHRTVIKALTAACTEVEAALEARISAEPSLARKRTILTSIPGIGARIASVVITDMPEPGTLDRKAAASLAGMAPPPTQSGAHPGRHAIAGGRPCLRMAFSMAGMVAARVRPAFRGRDKAMRAAGKPAKVAIVASGRHLAVPANALVRDDTPFGASKRQTGQQAASQGGASVSGPEVEA